MTGIEVLNRNEEVIDLIERKVRTGKEGKLKGKRYVLYKNKKCIVMGYQILPWGHR